MYYNLDKNNYKFFRFADALLMKAEALLRSGDMSNAINYLNITRTRAELPKLSIAKIGGNEEALMEEIRMESHITLLQPQKMHVIILYC